MTHVKVLVWYTVGHNASFLMEWRLLHIMLFFMVRYYELKLTLDDVEVTEETTYIPPDVRSSSSRPRTPSSPRRLTPLSPVPPGSPAATTRRRVLSAGAARLHEERATSEEAAELLAPMPTVLPGGVTARHEAVAAEQLTTSEGEERQRIVVKAIKDPRPASESDASGLTGTGRRRLGPGRLTMEARNTNFNLI